MRPIPKMTKTQFQYLADALKEAKPIKSAPQSAQWRRDVQAIAGVCSRANPLFDRSRFLTACEYEET